MDLYDALKIEMATDFKNLISNGYSVEDALDEVEIQYCDGMIDSILSELWAGK